MKKNPSPAVLVELARIRQKMAGDQSNPGNRLTIEEEMLYAYLKPCRKINPWDEAFGGHIDAGRSCAGSVLIKPDRVMVICDMDGKLPYRGELIRVAVVGPSRKSFGFLPGSRFVMDDKMVFVSKPGEIASMVGVNRIINKQARKTLKQNAVK